MSYNDRNHPPSCLPDIMPMTLSPRPSPSIIAYCKRSKTGGGRNGLGTRLGCKQLKQNGQFDVVPPPLKFWRLPRKEWSSRCDWFILSDHFWGLKILQFYLRNMPLNKTLISFSPQTQNLRQNPESMWKFKTASITYTQKFYWLHKTEISHSWQAKQTSLTINSGIPLPPLLEESIAIFMALGRKAT